MFRVNTDISTRNDGWCRTAIWRYQVAIFGSFVLLICESSTIQSKKNFLGVMPCVLSKKRRSRKLVTSIYYFGTNLSDTKGYDQSVNSSAFVIISLEVIAILVVTIKSDFGDRRDLDVATMLDTLCLALSHAAIFLVYFFSELVAGNSLADRYRQNAPCPDLIVPFQMERRGQSAKTLVSSWLDDN